MKRKIIDTFKVKDNLVLFTDTKLPMAPWRKVVVDGVEYETVTVYDSGDNVIAVKTDKDLKGKTIEFIKIASAKQ